VGAYEAFYQAYQKKPSDERYKLRGSGPGFPRRLCVSSTGAAARPGRLHRALTEFLRALEIDPSNELASQDIKPRARS